MSASQEQSVFPLKKLRLQRSFLLRPCLLAAFWALLGLGVLISVLVWQAKSALALLREERVWNEGTPARQAYVEGQEYTRHSLFRQYDLKVVYNDDDLTVYHKELSLTSLSKALDRWQSAEVRYNPENPEEFALLWALELRGGRWAAIALYSGFALLAALLSWGIAWSQWRPVRDALSCLRAPEHRLLTVREIKEPKKPTGDVVYRYVAPSAPGKPPREAEVFCPQSEGEPLFSDESRSHLVALVSTRRPTRHLVLRNDLYPLALAPEEASAIREKLRSAPDA